MLSSTIQHIAFDADQGTIVLIFDITKTGELFLDEETHEDLRGLIGSLVPGSDIPIDRSWCSAVKDIIRRMEKIYAVMLKDIRFVPNCIREEVEITGGKVRLISETPRDPSLVPNLSHLFHRFVTEASHRKVRRLDRYTNLETKLRVMFPDPHELYIEFVRDGISRELSQPVPVSR